MGNMNKMLEDLASVEEYYDSTDKINIYPELDLFPDTKPGDSEIEVYLINQKMHGNFLFPLNPIDEIKITYKKNYQTQEIVGAGEFDFYKDGDKITELSFKTILPKHGEMIEGFNKRSLPPRQAVDDLMRYASQREPVRLLITMFPFNEVVYISKLTRIMKAGMEEDRFIEISFRTHPDLIIKSIDTNLLNKLNKGLNKTERPNEKTATRTHKIVRGDTLWALAKKYLGSHNRWKEIWDLNKGIASSPRRIRDGTIIKIPKK